MTTATPRKVRCIWVPLTITCLLAVSAGASAQSTEARLDRLERLLDSRALMELSNENERLRRAVQELTGKLDSMEREISELRRHQRDLYADVDSRLQQLERLEGRDDAPSDTPLAEEHVPTVPETPMLDSDLAAAASEEPEAAEVTDTPEADVAGKVSDEDAGVAYQAAFDLLREGRYGAAGAAFRDVLEKHPNTREADNARYWLGESYYVVRDFNSAMDHFSKVAEDADNNKRPDAMLKIGYILYENGDHDQAREILETVRGKFPESTVATLAENRLQRIRDEGH